MIIKKNEKLVISILCVFYYNILFYGSFLYDYFPNKTFFNVTSFFNRSTFEHLLSSLQWRGLFKDKERRGSKAIYLLRHKRNYTW